MQGRIDFERDVGHLCAVAPRAGQQQRVCRIKRAIIADIGFVGVARDHHVGPWVERIENRTNLASKPGAGIGIVGIILAAALVDKNYDRIGALGLEQRNQRVDRRGLARKPQPLDPIGRDQIAGTLQSQPDYADLHLAFALAEGADGIGRE